MAQVRVFRYGEIEATEVFARTVGVSIARARALMAHPGALPEDPAVIALLDEGRLVGRYGLIPGHLQVGTRRFRVNWGTDWWVDRTRHLGAGGLLLMSALHEAGSLTGLMFSAYAKSVYRAARFELATVPRYVLPIRAAPYLRRVVRWQVLAKAVALPVDASLGILRRAYRLRGPRWSSAFSLEEVPAVDTAVDDIDATSSIRCRFPRGSAELNWMIAFPWHLPPVSRFHAYYMRTQGGRVEGYALARTRRYRDATVTSILRWGVRSDEPVGVRALLALVSGALAREGVDLLDISASSEVVRDAARQVGMLRYGHRDLACRFAPSVAAALQQEGCGIGALDIQTGEGDIPFD